MSTKKFFEISKEAIEFPEMRWYNADVSNCDLGSAGGIGAAAQRPLGEFPRF